MSGSNAPTNAVFSNGVGVINDANLNAFAQNTTNLSTARNFTGISGMGIILQGYVTAGDGGGGIFYWATGPSYVDDNGVTTIVPYGVTSGAWLRIAILVTPTSNFTNVNVTGTLTVDGVANLLSTVNITGTANVTGAVIAAGEVSTNGSLFVGGNAGIEGGLEVTGGIQATGSIVAASALVAGTSGAFGTNINANGTLFVGGATYLTGAAVCSAAIGATEFEVTASSNFITGGAAAPSASLMKGSIYLRNAGSVGATLYVSQGGGTWNAVAGV